MLKKPWQIPCYYVAEIEPNPFGIPNAKVVSNCIIAQSFTIDCKVLAWHLQHEFGTVFAVKQKPMCV